MSKLTTLLYSRKQAKPKSKRTKPKQTEAKPYQTKLYRRNWNETKRNNILPHSTNPNKIQQNKQQTVPHQIQQNRTELQRCYKLHNKSAFRNFQDQTSTRKLVILFEGFFWGRGGGGGYA